jgi:cyclopropane-fatty-acyl-phospholipid synthase
VTYHYDTGNEFYSLFLGRWMAYSCAYFPAREADLDAAQTAKLEHICRKLRLRPGERLLDIG